MYYSLYFPTHGAKSSICGCGWRWWLCIFISHIIVVIALCKKRIPAVPAEITKISPVESFVPNIYRAGMDDGLAHTVGKKGAQLDEWNSGGEALFGRTAL